MSTNHSPAPAHSSIFQPLFTLVSSTSTSHSSGSSTEYHHPTVHYIFSDDPDPHDPITTAALQTLQPASHSSTPSHPSHQVNSPSHPIPGEKKERFLILDLDLTGTKITNASSMSPDWAVTSAFLEKAPSWEGEETEEGRGTERMMLRVEGCEVGSSGEDEGDKEKEKDVGVEELLSRFEKGMVELRKVVEMGIKK
ncbi:MAG: hypothetical protein Q9209_001479 [Squamulea sp. 1 TL-2023]